MTDFKINVVVDPRRAKSGARQVERSLERIEQRANRTRDIISRAFAFVGVGAVVAQTTRLVDTYDNLQNRIKTVTSSTREQIAVNEKLLKIANETRSSYEGSVELFTRIARATRDLGTSQKETLQFTESLNHAILLSGATTAEAQNGLIQLSQGLASGALRGDELRSVLEQLPEVADVIAKSLGITRGELRKFGTDGKLTAEVVLKAFADAQEDLEARFNKMAPTMGQAFTVLRNNAIKLAGDISDATGLSKRLAGGILFLSQNLDVLARAAAAAGIALLTLFVKRGLNAAIMGVRALTAAILANPIGALTVVIVSATAALIAFSDQILIGGNNFTTIADVGVAAAQIISEAWAKLANFFAPILNQISTMTASAFGNISLSFRGVVTGIAKGIDFIIGLNRGMIGAVTALIDMMINATVNGFTSMFNTISDRLTGFVNGIISTYNAAADLIGLSLIEPIEAWQIEAGNRAEVTGQDVAKRFTDGFKSQTGAQELVEELFVKADEVALKRIAAANAEALALDKAGSLLDSSGAGGGAGETTDPIEKIETLLDRVKANFTDVASVIESSLVNAFSSAEDALVKFVSTGKFSFKDLSNSIIQDLTRIAIRKAITAPLFGMLPTGVGTETSTGLPGFATGGSFEVGGMSGRDQNTLSLNGAPIAKVSKGETVNVANNGGGSPITVNFNVQANDADSFRRSEDQIMARASRALSRAQQRNN